MDKSVLQCVQGGGIQVQDCGHCMLVCLDIMYDHNAQLQFQKLS